MLNSYKYGFSDDVKPKIEFGKGLTPMIIKEISQIKEFSDYLKKQTIQ